MNTDSDESPIAEHSKIVVLGFTGGLWKTRPVVDQPGLTLRSWSVRQLPDGDRHFVGWCIENREGRVSSKIEAFDANTKRGFTSTGRVYELAGPPGYDRDAEYVWDAWKRINCVTDFIDVTRELRVDALLSPPLESKD